MTAVVVAVVSWCSHRALSARRSAWNWPAGIPPPCKQCCSHTAALSAHMCCALRAELCCKFSVASSVCVSWNENAEERACDLALMWALGSLHLQANFTEILCKWHRFYWTLRSCICRRMSLITKNAYGCLVFVLTNPIYFARAWFLTWLNVSETFLLF